MFVKNLRSDVENPEARHVHSWIEEGLFDAINKQYLKALILSIHDFDSDSLLECYQYRFDYSAGLNVELDRTQIDQPLSSASIISNSNRTSQMNNDSVITKEEAKSQTTKLLQGLIALTQTLGPLPDKRYLSMRLAYYDERVPQDYNPPHFHAIPDPKTSTDSKTTKNNVQGADLNLSTDKASGKIIGSQKLKMPSVANLTFAEGADVQEFNLGRLATGYHALGIKVRTTAISLEGEEEVEDDDEESLEAVRNFLLQLPASSQGGVSIQMLCEAFEAEESVVRAIVTILESRNIISVKTNDNGEISITLIADTATKKSNDKKMDHDFLQEEAETRPSSGSGENPGLSSPASAHNGDTAVGDVGMHLPPRADESTVSISKSNCGSVSVAGCGTDAQVQLLLEAVRKIIQDARLTGVKYISKRTFAQGTGLDVSVVGELVDALVNEGGWLDEYQPRKGYKVVCGEDKSKKRRRMQ